MTRAAVGIDEHLVRVLLRAQDRPRPELRLPLLGDCGLHSLGKYRPEARPTTVDFVEQVPLPKADHRPPSRRRIGIDGSVVGAVDAHQRVVLIGTVPPVPVVTVCLENNLQRRNCGVDGPAIEK